MKDIEKLEDVIKKCPQMEYETNHYFGGGIYEREIRVPAGKCFTGKVHLTEHLAKLVKGTMTIVSEEGEGTFTGPYTFVSYPGAKRAGISHDNVVFSTFHHVGTLTNIDDIEKMLVVDSESDYLEHITCHLLHQEQA